jgi:CHAD domain-containing protein
LIHVNAEMSQIGLPEADPNSIFPERRKMRTSALRDTTASPSTDLVARPSRIMPDCSAIFREIAKDCVRAIRTNRQRAIAGDPEAVHTMRIELTRLRAAALFFQPWIPGTAWQPLNKELDWLNSVLGKARNLDVTIQYAERKRYQHWAKASRRELVRSQENAHRQLAKELRLARYNRLISELDRWLKRCPSRDAKKASALNHVNEFCEKRLRAWRDELSNQGRHVGTIGRKQQHQLRIQSKNYRYVVESLLNLNVPLSREDFAFCETAKDIHQALGDLRDLRRLRKSVCRRPPRYRKQTRKLKRRVKRMFHGAHRSR